MRSSPIVDNAIERAMRSVLAEVPRASADPDRPRRHLLPPGRWMNDPNGTILHDGWYHVFYQHHPYGDAWGSMHWGHARSRDLIHWQHLPIALAPHADRGEEHCFSGCIAIADDGTAKLIYTSIAPKGGRPSEQWCATGSVDLAQWQLAGAAIGRDRAGEPEFDDAMRDPFVFAAGGKRWLVLGATLGDESVLPIYEAADGSLERWRYRGLMHREAKATLPYPECPNVMPLGNRMLTLVSPCGAVRWYLGRFADGHFAVERTGAMDLADQWYASNTLVDADGRTVVLGWVRGFPEKRGWSGCLAFPRLVEADARAGIRQLPHPCVATLRDGPPVIWRGVVHGEHVLAADAGDGVELDLRARGPLTIQLDAAQSGGVELRWDGTSLHVAGAAYAVAAPDGELDLRLFIDRSVIEIFADGGRSVITRVVAGGERGGRAILRASDPVAVSATLHRLAPCRHELVGW